MNKETTSCGRFDDVNRKRGGQPPDEWFRHPIKEHMSPAAALINQLNINAKVPHQNVVLFVSRSLITKSA